MFDTTIHNFCSEFYTIENSIVVVVRFRDGSHHIRLDALKDERSEKYSIRSYKEESVTVQPTYPQSSGKYNQSPQNYRVWVGYELPWVDADSADNALRLALVFLRGRVVE